ncbi:MAG: cytidylyltransferase domain-containing protein [Anaerolineales bacterium]
MVTRPEILALIPARGGSKGIPRKNVRSFAGYPLISYSIMAALQSETVTRTILSTDDLEIAEVARQWGAEVPFMRPTELAQDGTTDLPVFQHALHWLAENENYHPDLVIQLRPTSPIRPLRCVDEAVKLLLDHPDADSVRGVVPSGQNPFKMWKIKKDNGLMHPLLELEDIPEPYNAPRQELPLTYWQTGHIDVIHTEVILEKDSMSGTRILPYLIDSAYTVDIDNLFDWKRYEWQVMHGGLKMVDPANRRKSFPKKISLVVMDFDGVLTDNRVWVDSDGNEMVAAFRGDSMGINKVRSVSDTEFLVISTETNPVVAARCSKLNLQFHQGIKDKAQVLKEEITSRGLITDEVVFIGNDVNDLGCFDVAGYTVAPADAEKVVIRQADLVLNRDGGHGAVREFCDLILESISEKN